MSKWRFEARRTVARRIAAELRHKLSKYTRKAQRHDFIDVRATVTYWQLVAEALEEVTKTDSKL